MTPSRTPRPRFRLQFSLRALLVVMVLVGVALTIYRWPWEDVLEYSLELEGAEIKPDSGLFHGAVDPALDFRGQKTIDARYVRTFRRDWQGKPVLHGPIRAYIAGVLMEETWFRDNLGNGSRRYFNGLGHVTEETYYREGVRHGSHRIGDGTTWVHVGQYLRNEKDGAWRVLENRLTGPQVFWLVQTEPFAFNLVQQPQEWDRVPDHAIVVQQQWRRGLRHGRWEWRTRDGELLNTADYSADGLTHWNGQAVEPWLQALYGECAADPALVATLQRPAGLLANARLAERMGPLMPGRAGLHDDWLGEAEEVFAPVDCSVIHFETRRRSPSLVSATQSIGLNLVEMALLNGFAMQYRYGGLWFVPASEASGSWRDPTGIDRIQFEPGSSQAREWEEPVELADQQSVVGSAAWLRYVLHGTSIKLDLNPLLDQINDEPALAINRNRFRTFRKRRDVLGHFLYRTGLACEQRGSTLVIQRHWTGGNSFAEFEGTNFPSWRTSPFPERLLLE